jgi:hypothetical protein
MLTLTYALVALSVEQKKVQGSLLELQHRMQREKSRGVLADIGNFETLLKQFLHLDETCRFRNIELYVLPAIRSATSDADSILAEIEALTSMGRIILKNVGTRMRQAFAQGALEVEDLCNSLEMYSQQLMKRLTMEETHLLPVAQRVISSDEWFDIAAQFISHESERHPKAFGQDDDMPAPAHAGAFAQESMAYQTVTI